jgi:hypothetical protein
MLALRRRGVAEKGGLPARVPAAFTGSPKAPAVLGAVWNLVKTWRGR